MIKSFLLGNFKAFGPTQRIPLRPLTLIFGPNSAGKSSLIHALLMAHEAQTSDDSRNLDVTRPRLGGDSVDLGGFRQFVHKKNLDSQVEWGVEFETADFSGRLAELLAPVSTVAISVTIGLARLAINPTANEVEKGAGNGQSVEIAAPQVQTYQVLTDDRVLIRGSVKRRGNDWWMGIDELDGENPVVLAIVRAIIEASTTTESLQDDDFQTVQRTIDDLVPTLFLIPGRFIPSGVGRPSSESPEEQQATFFPISRGNRQADLRQVIDLYLPRVFDELIKGLASVIDKTLHSLRYLGPLRSYPPRHLAFAQYHDPNWYAGGGYAWDRVRTDPKVRDAVNEWLSSSSRMKTPYRLVVRDLYADDDLVEPLLTSLEQMVDDGLTIEGELDREGNIEYGHPTIKDYDREIARFRANLESSGIEFIRDLMLVDVNRNTVVSHRDVGIGVSQVLPVLVAAFGAKGETVAIEQPEIHLHPALQAELGDVFISAAVNGTNNTFLLETHSEHLILRIMRRIRETTDNTLPSGLPPIRADDVVVLFVEPTEKLNRVRILELDSEGAFLDPWPGGFFEEGFRERFGG